MVCTSTILLRTLIVLSHVVLLINADLLEPNCPGSCNSILDCKSMGGKMLGICMDGKICCSGSGGFNVPTASCGSSFMSHSKFSKFQSPNYPVFAGGNLNCEFTLQLNPSTVGIRVDFVDLNLPSVPSNPVNFYESPTPICDSDFMIFKGFHGWMPDIRCGNLTGYSLLMEREKGQSSLSTLFIMASRQYRWNVQFTEIYYNEVELLDYTLKTTTHNGNNQNNKKQWIWYPSSGLVPPFSPVGPLPPPPSLLAPPSMQLHPFRKRNTEDSFEVINVTSIASNSTETLNDDSPLSRVVGGIDAQPNSIPWQVSLQLIEKAPSSICGEGNTKNLSSHFCGGSIIGPRAILTASHCFFSSSRFSHPLIPSKDVKVVVGDHDLCNEGEVASTKEYSIERVIFHFNYMAADVINDIAVIHLTKPIMFDHNVRPISLPDDHTKIENLKPLLSGWGSMGVEENSTYPAILQQTSNLLIFSERECQRFQREFLDYIVPDSKLPGKYAGAFDRGICTKPTDNIAEAGFGDSGGPLAGIPSSSVKDNKSPVLLGVVSHMRPHVDPETNQEFHLNFFAKVSSYRKWILKAMVI